MRVQTGFRRLDQPMEDAIIYLTADMDGGGLEAVVRVIPDCGHTYFIRGEDANSPSSRSAGAARQSGSSGRRGATSRSSGGPGSSRNCGGRRPAAGEKS